MPCSLRVKKTNHKKKQLTEPFSSWEGLVHLSSTVLYSKVSNYSYLYENVLAQCSTVVQLKVHIREKTAPI